MLNQYPLWKNLLIVGVVVLGIIYAMPNFYPPDYAIQIQNEQGSAAVKDPETGQCSAFGVLNKGSDP